MDKGKYAIDVEFFEKRAGVYNVSVSVSFDQYRSYEEPVAIDKILIVGPEHAVYAEVGPAILKLIREIKDRVSKYSIVKLGFWGIDGFHGQTYFVKDLVLCLEADRRQIFRESIMRLPTYSR